MKKTIVMAAVAGLALISAVAYAQTHDHGSAPDDSKPTNTPREMRGNMQGGMMHGGGMMHSGMMDGMMQRGMQGATSGSHKMQPKGDDGPASLAFHGANMKMHSGMDITYSGNTDVDFVKGMIPHHAGAVDMAKIVIAFGKDPEVKRLAESIIKAQESEIAFMQEWLRKNAK